MMFLIALTIMEVIILLVIFFIVNFQCGVTNEKFRIELILCFGFN